MVYSVCISNNETEYTYVSCREWQNVYGVHILIATIRTEIIHDTCYDLQEMVEGDSRVNIISNNKTKKEITNLSKAHIKQSISKKKLFLAK